MNRTMVALSSLVTLQVKIWNGHGNLMEHWKFPPVLEAYLKIGVVLSLEGDFLQERVEITSAL